MARKASPKRSYAPPAVGLLLAVLAVVAVVLAFRGRPDPVPAFAGRGSSSRPSQQPASPRFQPAGLLTLWWDSAPAATPTAQLAGGAVSNMHPGDYIGPDACRECHRENYDAWSRHSHRWMNALADESTVKGSFQGEAISYLGGTARFYRVAPQNADQHAPQGRARFQDPGYRMELVRGTVRKLYRIHQTIGSRFFQYYVGKLMEGPEPPGHPARTTDHVLPFGYWLDRGEWVPVVHVGTRGESPDGLRDDPFAADPAQQSFSPYYECNSCHTTFALGDQMIRSFWVLGRHAPRRLHWSMFDYVADHHGGLLGGKDRPAEFSDPELERLFFAMSRFEAPDHAATLGVSCEACHLGSKEHALGNVEKPSFFPQSPHLLAEGAALESGRVHANVNWACGRCHTGDRPLFAGGMSTWNSTEYTDAMRGSCYSELACIDCHDPHTATGPTWTRTAAEDDASCLRCHDKYEPPAARAGHTHHAAGSEGSRCLNCHMPRLNEGLQNVVRTHTIYSPTKAEMIEANHPNACGLCHTDKPIDWTLAYLREWYGKTYSAEKIAANYPRRDQPAVIGWLTSANEAVRLAATDAVARQQDRAALPALIGILDDPFLLNRQFARIALEDWLGVRLADFGYRFYMTPDERRAPIERVRHELLRASSQSALLPQPRADEL